MRVRRGKKPKYLIRAESGLLDDPIWKLALQGYPTPLICSLRQELLKEVPGITESFNTNSRYFGYWRKDEKDRLYIYVQKKNLRIDLCIDPNNKRDLENKGFKIKRHKNFQDHSGWLTGWQVPHEAEDIKTVMKYLVMSFED